MWQWLRLLVEGVGWITVAAGAWWILKPRVNDLLLVWFVLRHKPRG